MTEKLQKSAYITISPITGQELKERREALNLTQQQLADCWGIRQATIGDWEREKKPILMAGVVNAALLYLESNMQAQ